MGASQDNLIPVVPLPLRVMSIGKFVALPLILTDPFEMTAAVGKKRMVKLNGWPGGSTFVNGRIKFGTE